MSAASKMVSYQPLEFDKYSCRHCSHQWGDLDGMVMWQHYSWDGPHGRMPCKGSDELPREHSYRYTSNARTVYSDGHGPGRAQLEAMASLDLDIAFLNAEEAVDTNAADFWNGTPIPEGQHQ